jgi:hypothetical protein
LKQCLAIALYNATAFGRFDENNPYKVMCEMENFLRKSARDKNKSAIICESWEK